MEVAKNEAADFANLRLEHEALQKRYDALEAAYAKLLLAKGSSSEETDKTAEKPSSFAVWSPYIKIAVLSSVTALLMFIVAERQYTSGQKVGFGFLAAVGGAGVFLAIPATHWIGHFLHDDYKIWQPFRGGVRFVVLQAISWTFYGITAVIVMAAVAFAEHNNGMLASAGVVGLLSQVFMVSSLLTYSDPSQTARKARRIWRQNSGVINADDPTDEVEEEARQVYMSQRRPSTDSEYSSGSGSTSATDRSARTTMRRRSVAKSIIDHDAAADEQQVPLDKDYSTSSVVKEFVQMNTFLVVIGIVLGVLSEHSPDSKHKPIFGILSLVCCIVAISLTHGIGGRLRHINRGWSFAQFFRGGKEFILLQIFGWSFFGVAIIAQGAFVLSSVYLGTHGMKGTMYVGALATVISHYAIFLSFVLYMILFCAPYVMPESSQPWLAEATYGLLPELSANSAELGHTFKVWWILLCAISFWTFFYSALNTWGVDGWRQSLLLSLAAVAAYGGVIAVFRESPHYAMLVVICSANLVYISTTFTKRPEYNACREWSIFKEIDVLPRLAEKFFGLRLQLTEEMQRLAPVLGDVNAKDPKNQQVLLLFHPHGILPVTHGILQITHVWRKIFPHLDTNPLTATITHVVPVMRDVIQWMGCCDVSRATVHNLIRMGRNVQIVCGGQTEMFESRSWDNRIAIVRKRRRGIFKIAIQQGLGIVPMFSFGEPQIFDNVYMPRTQAFFKNLLGFPFPIFMLGKFGLPIPCRVPVTVALDAPVHPVRQTANPTPEEITEFQDRYFATLEALFERYKEENGHGSHELSFIDN
ncbi:Diacylglycerol O-acyltransferase 2 [Hondaea fermentalgiana]|uniref:Diacylglycerol O-acyltransferase 2 n=1 Tax=Hondaea fermentalgiana TaxID=2315210 RepID=A0A2R5GMV5_9STRA|nr:Diacylglycerol O-acyltransferase 2 [Hondaea fermentalgiana]|eukprot:GBG31058.1 Diacylglycerol O-acyltransferase 2 [Hondaea fermentalgiana]